MDTPIDPNQKVMTK